MTTRSNTQVRANDFIFMQSPGQDQSQYMQFLYDGGYSVRDIALLLTVEESLVLSKIKRHRHVESPSFSSRQLSSYLHEFSE